MQCPNCGTQNADNFRFCMKCGTALTVAPNVNPADVQSTTGATFMPPASIPYQAPSNPAPTPTSTVYQPAQLPVDYQAPQPPAAYTPAQPPVYNQPQSYTPRVSPSADITTTVMNIWGPFAGYGTRRKHIGWLMDNKGDCAELLIQKVKMNFINRKIPNTSVNHEVLTARGAIVESRPYFILRRGLASVGLFITQFGRDLYISLASYLKPPISNFRAIVLAVMALFALYTIFIFPSSINKALNSAMSGYSGGLFGSPSAGNSSALGSLLCIVGPLGSLNLLLLFAFAAFGTYKWLIEKDFWAGLRVQPNEFNEDDLMAMEKAVEQTVRISLDEIGLNPDDLKPTDIGNNQRII